MVGQRTAEESKALGGFPWLLAQQQCRKSISIQRVRATIQTAPFRLPHCSLGSGNQKLVDNVRLFCPIAAPAMQGTVLAPSQVIEHVVSVTDEAKQQSQAWPFLHTSCLNSLTDEW